MSLPSSVFCYCHYRQHHIQCGVITVRSRVITISMAIGAFIAMIHIIMISIFANFNT